MTGGWRRGGRNEGGWGGRVEETDGMKLSMQTNEARELTKS